MKTKTLFFVLILVFSLAIYSQLMAQKFDFNDGTKQGWTMQGAYDESGNGPYPSNFTLGWTKLVNYPSPDPSSTKGSLLFYTPGGHGVIGSSGTYWIMGLQSPDLSLDPSWQSTTGFSVRIVENMTVGSPLYANLIVTVYDYDQSKERSFYNDLLLNQPLTYSSWFNANAVWNYLTFDWSNISSFPTNYLLKKVTVQIMGTMTGLWEGQVGIDEVVAQTGTGPTTSIKVVTPNGGEKWEAGMQHNITWTGQGIDNYDVKIEYSTNNGATYTFMDYKTNYGTSGSYAWTVPNTPSTQCLVRLAVLLPPEIFDVSDAVFEITQPSQPFIFTGHVYQGNPPDISTPVGGITVKLYGDDDEWPENGPKTELAPTTTNILGEFNLNSGSGNSNYNYYHVMETDPAGGISVGAQAGHPGYVKNFNCISYENTTLTPGNTYSGSAFWDIQSSTGNTSTGFDVLVTLSDDVSITFDEVTAAGNTTLETSHIGPEPPNNFVVHPYSTPMYYDINTTAGYSDSIHLTIHYDDTELDTEMENDLWIFRFSEPNSEWLGITTSVDIDNNFIRGLTDHLSVFAIMYQIEGPGESRLIVTNCDDSGPGSFRNAILYANSNSGPDMIRFQIPKDVPGHDSDIGVWTIAPQSELPSITDAGLIIDGFSQGEFIGEDSNPQGPEIQLDGSNAGASGVGGLNIYTAVIEIYGLTINHFSGAGIYLHGAEDVRISGCYIGADFAGIDSAGNETGLFLRQGTKGVYIGPTDSLKAGNVISGNKFSGVLITDSSSHNIVVGNFIGLNRMGAGLIGNQYGISIWNQSDSNQVFDNRIGGNSFGVAILEANDNLIANNLIGTDEAWQLELGNLADGVNITGSIKAQGNIIEENLIGFSGQSGVEVFGAQAIHNSIRRNILSRNGGLGINNIDGGNTELTPPVIVTATSSQVTGTAGAGQIVEVFADENDEGFIYLGSTTADASGNFILTLSNPLPPLPYVTATATDAAGNTSEFSSAFITAVGDELQPQVPEAFSLSQNYPNPFNPQTTIHFEIPSTGKQMVKVGLHIYNLQGQLICTLINEERSPGAYQVRWDGLDEGGNNVVTGIYLYRIRAGEFTATKKMILTK